MAKSSDLVHFEHESARQYLMSGKAPHGFVFTESAVHQYMAKLCLIHLLFVDQAKPKDFPNHFLSYAAEFWHHHVRAGSTAECRTPALDLIKRFLDPGASISRYWCYPPETSANGLHTPSPSHRLYISALFGLPEVAEWLLTMGADINARVEGEHEYALVAAAAGGYLEVVKILLERGAKLDVRGAWGTALQVAETGGHDAVVQVLVNTADVMPEKISAYLSDGDLSDTEVQLLSFPPVPRERWQMYLQRLSSQRLEFAATPKPRRTIKRRLPESLINRFADVLDCLGISYIMQFLSICDIIRLGQCCRIWRQIVHDWLMQSFFPVTRIDLRTNLGTHKLPPLYSYQKLYPVIGRLLPEERILPAGRLLFEPDGDTPRQAHQLGQFTPDEVRLHLPDWSTSHCWHLGDERRTGPRHDIQQVGNRRDQDADRYTLTATAVIGIHKLHYLNSGIQVFYKTDSDAVIIHALSIPWQSLINKLLKDPEPRFHVDGSLGRTAEYFEV
jgi:hypothetical protein